MSRIGKKSDVVVRVSPGTAEVVRRVALAARASGIVSGVENGGRFRQAQVAGKRSVCAMSVSAARTLCGEERYDADGNERAEVGADVWFPIRGDGQTLPEDYRPCADCAAEYRAIPGPSRKRVTWVDVPDPDKGTDADGKPVGTKPVLKMITTADPMSERLPEVVDSRGQAVRDAERTERMRAWLGDVVPLLSVGADGKIAREFLVTLGSNVVHVGWQVHDEGFMLTVCSPYASARGKVAEDDDAKLTCSGCRKILYRGRTVKPSMVAVMRREHDADRFRPVGGVGARSSDPRTRETDALLMQDERARAAQMMYGTGVMDGGRIHAGYREYTVTGGDRPATEHALRGWAVEMMKAPVRERRAGALTGEWTTGRLLYADGWECLRATGKAPERVWRAMSREEKTAFVRGMRFVRERQALARSRRRVAEREAEAVTAVREYGYAVRNGTQRREPKRGVSNPYPSPGGVFSELRDPKQK